MPSSRIPDRILRQISVAAREWAREWSDPYPRHGKVVSTTRPAVMRQMYGGGVTAPNEPVYLVTFEGCFFLQKEEGAEPRTGTWAALMIDPILMRVTTYTVRPPNMVPEFPLTVLGDVRELDLE
ncbi:hypothetical protein [Streptomyces sp. NPDC046939]|uniref:hypothetical protein n=1 Tax=Streptomyces sp. NPDC046939 TaxID=3155376 RepID=UPI0033DEB98C